MAERLAPGVRPAEGFIPLIVPEIRGNEWTYVRECLDTGWVSSVGSYVDRFEKMVAEYVGAKYAVATVNGTAALHVSLMLAGVQPGDEVLVSALTFIAPVNAVRYVGAWPVFIDCEPNYGQMSPTRVAEFLLNECKTQGKLVINKATGRRVSAILPVHILGHPAEIDSIVEVAAKYSLPVIEDATEGLGARYRGRSLGSFGDVGCFSFNGNKIITTGGGGMLVTDDAEWAGRARYLTTQAKDDPVEYVHKAIGFNYRLTNVLAAIGCAQMEQLDGFIETKRQIARRYEEGLSKASGLQLPRESESAFSTFWMYTILVKEETAGISSRELLRELHGERIQTRPLWQPINRSPAHQDSGGAACPVADTFYAEALSLPCSVGLTSSEQEHVIGAVKGVLAKRQSAARALETR